MNSFIMIGLLWLKRKTGGQKSLSKILMKIIYCQVYTLCVCVCVCVYVCMCLCVHAHAQINKLKKPRIKIIVLFSFTVHLYSVEVYTGRKPNAGTNANVYMIMYGERGDTGKRKLLKSNNKDKFVAGQVILLNTDYLNNQHKWLFSLIPIIKVTPSAWKTWPSDSTHSLKKHLKDAPTLWLVMTCATSCTAFTNYVIQCLKVCLLCLQMDRFKLRAVHLGDIQKITIGHDGKGAGSGWFLEKVVVIDPVDSEESTTFECNR